MTSTSMVDIRELAPSFSTRRRGDEAFCVLEPKLRAGRVIIDLDTVELVSPSFIDGLLFRVQGQGYKSTDVVFRTKRARIRKRLDRIRNLRGIELCVHEVDS